MTKRSKLASLLVLSIVLVPPIQASADAAAPQAASDPTCPADLRDEVLYNLWERKPGAKPGPKAPTVHVTYQNDYGRAANALLIAIDGVPAFFKCGAPEGAGEVFLGPLAPGVHHVDAVFNFGFGRVGRAEYVLKVKPGRDVQLEVGLGRDEHEHPVAYFEVTPAPATKK